MTIDQHPIESSFNFHSTAADVVADAELTGKTAVVTGGYSGLGLEITRALATSGATVIIPARRPDAARAATADLPRIEVGTMDLADLASVRAFADTVTSGSRPIDIVIGNAGVMASPELRLGQRWESQFAINHLGHFALANELMPALIAADGARLISVSSAGHHNSPIRWDDPQFDQGYDKWLAYGQSKTANALFALHLDRIGAPYGVRAFSLHPGKILTPLQRHLTTDEMIDFGWIHADGTGADPGFKTPQQGAATATWAATSKQLNDLGGLYCEDCNVAEVATEPLDEPTGVRDYACDSDQAARLWALSADLTEVAVQI
ncbi:oxidoreductase [Rhodococcus sp. 1168]|uniref:oxidoreductase n=1 Tax=Rhodococcus sp. 1168 TaxID=2018041 RepID=UPI000A0AFFF8|nr:oxidoreductase [Rhodococcus sp. 1168]ORI17326.1 oxidoreductase [Rhodococcus sp. 1168]